MTQDKLIVLEGEWYPVHVAEDNHRYLRLTRDQLPRTIFRMKGDKQYFIVLPPLPEN